ncbi:hypothetical protein D9M71_687500 [compost metagenome]
MPALLVGAPEEAEVAVFACQFVVLFHHAFEVFAPDALVQVEAVGHLQGQFGNNAQYAQRHPTRL